MLQKECHKLKVCATNMTETDICVCSLHATNITTIGVAREFRKVGKRFSKI